MISKALRGYIKDPGGDVFYAAVSFSNRNDYTDYSLSDDSESEGFGGSDSEIGSDDELKYSQQTVTLHKLYSGGVSRVAKRSNWTYGNVYKAWPNEGCHVVARSFTGGAARLNVYRCMFSPLTPSTVAPTDNQISEFYSADGYVWKYLYTISDAESLLFMDEDWIPVPEVVSEQTALTSAVGSLKYIQYLIQKNAVYGVIYNAVLDSDAELTDSDFVNITTSSPLTVQVEDLSGTTPTQTAEFEFYRTSATSRVLIRLNAIGKGYVGPFRCIKKGTTSTVSGVSCYLPPGVGHGSNLPEEMNATRTKIVVKNVPDGNILNVMDNTKFNVVSLVRNPVDLSTKQIAQKSNYIACRSFEATGVVFDVNDIASLKVLNDNSLRVVAVNGSRIYYTNLKDESNTVAVGDLVFNSTSVIGGTVTAVYDREIVFNSFDHIVVDVKDKQIQRAKDQIESFSFVLGF